MPAKSQDPHRRELGKLTAQDQAEADALRQTATASALATCLGKTYGQIVGSNGFRAYVDDALAAAGSPSDPIERMLVEQLLMAHHRIGELHAQSACADRPEEAALYNAAAARLLNEFRKTSLALREYRTPVVSRSLTVVNQQNVAAGSQQIAYVDAQKLAEKNPSRSELISTEAKALTYEQPIFLNTEPPTCRRGEAEPLEAKRTHT